MNCGILGSIPNSNFISQEVKTLQYFYLSDHLGSSSWISDKDGNALQHLSYLPFGEVFANQKAQNSSFDTEYKFLGKERDTETGFDYFGARYYVSELGIWLSVDPMSLLYPHQSPYAYCSNNPITRIDLNGMSDSPYYDKNGNFLGVDEHGFSGNIFITTREAFNANATNGIADSKKIQSNNATFNIKNYPVNELSLEAQSKILTNILQDMNDIDLSNLYNNKVSINTNKTINGKRITYNDADNYPRLGYGKAENGQHKVTAKTGQLSSLGTVEAIKSYLGVHEYQGHGVKGHPGGHTVGHQRVYRDQYNHWTFKSLSIEQQKEIINRMNGIW